MMVEEGLNELKMTVPTTDPARPGKIPITPLSPMDCGTWGWLWTSVEAPAPWPAA